ncbi:uncharacterized protein [Triticum aestivum]|uniref:uncharacterized protein isoform X2 n=1 Tax=Triticum aestivum TaxID=4565 RepID=UPI001D01623C|nr:uncharacterized protein LOC123136788 isoform X2 [Triticum aestivum]
MSLLTGCEYLSSSSKQAEVVTHDVSPMSTHSSPLISARKPPGWHIQFFIRIDLGGSYHTYPHLGGPFRSLEETEKAIKSHLDGLRSPIMCRDGLSSAEVAVRHRLYWPDGTRKKSFEGNPGRRNMNLLVQALLDKYNEDHHLLGNLAYELDNVVCSRQIYEKEGGLINKFYHINLTAKTKGDDGFHVDNLFFGEITRIEGENEEYMLNCFCMVKPIDNGGCSGCTKYGEYDLKHPVDADKYKGGHSTPAIQCRGINHIPFLQPDVPVYIRNKQDWLEFEKAMLAKEEAKIRYIYECPADSPIQAKVDGARMPAGLAKGQEDAGLAKGRESAGLAKRGEGADLTKRGEDAGLAKREDHQGSVKYVVPARRGVLF